MQGTRQWHNGVIYGLFSLISLGLLFFVWRFGVNIPWGDEWDALLFINKTGTSGLDFRALFAQHNEHRIAVPRLIMLANTTLFSFNLKYQMYLTATGLIAVSLICFYRFTGVVSPGFRWLALIAPLLICSFRQSENLLWGFQIGLVLSLLLPVIAFHILAGSKQCEPGPYWIVAALLSGLLGSFSSSQGLFFWPCAVLLTALSGERNKWPAALLAGAGIIVWGLYFSGYVKPAGHPTISYIMEHPYEGFRFFCMTLGNLVAWREDVSFAAGFLFLAAFIAALAAATAKKRLVELRFWIALGLFSLMVLFAITLGRAGSGIDAAFASRYTTFSAVFAVSLLAILAALSTTGSMPGFRILLIPVTLLLLVAAPFSYLQGWNSGKFMHGEFTRLSFLLKNYRMVPAQSLQYLYIPNPQVVKERAPFLEKLGHEIFSR
ncbi:hypothetical protein OR1_03389 [Geobacter sp. OR-1]|uniref:hypothetical protein n=1 Tax=Geobacter sp. OR-1 TaxID=1266765 RepID=UPI00054242DC|nr:hypothetical protein [Geobacter sp. OR-1]GAM11080.1 hypothetical protein OR1_03389 [Geobacter sp. OR-1]